MKAFFDKLERLFVAVTFAEAGEAETARQLADPESTAAAGTVGTTPPSPLGAEIAARRRSHAAS